MNGSGKGRKEKIMVIRGDLIINLSRRAWPFELCTPRYESLVPMTGAFWGRRRVLLALSLSGGGLFLLFVSAVGGIHDALHVFVKFEASIALPERNR